jgi:signal transduction histidine kinase
VAFLFYLRLVGLTAGTLVYLFLIALILGHRRPRLFERLLFFLVLSLFLIYAGGLLEINAAIQYASQPQTTRWFYQGLTALGLMWLLPLVWHAHYSYRRQIRGSRPSALARPLLIVLYLIAAGEAALGLTLFGGTSLNMGLQVSLVLGYFVDAGRSALPVVALLDAVFELQDWRAAKNQAERGLFRSLFLVSALLAVLLIVKSAGVGTSLQEQILIATALFAGVLPGALLVYYALKHNFLEFGAQRNLVYALSAMFLALLYLALVRRVSGWFEPMLPPEATASILLFVLIFLFEPLERVIGPALQRSIQERMGRVQSLAVELREEARNGDLTRLVAHAEQRIREELGLAAVRLSVPRDPWQKPLESPGGLGHVVRMPLLEGRKEVGILEAASTGSYLTGETTAALDFLAEQLPAMLDLCRLIEEKVRLERELAERERLAVLGQMAASVSHNLRNPLSSMKTILQVQLENPDLPAGVRNDCGLVLGEIDRMSAKLKQLLNFAKPSANGERVAAVALAKQTAELFRHDAERRNVVLEFNAPTEEVRVVASEEALSEVLSNLIVNAIEAQPDGGRVQIALARRDDRLEIRIEDTGPGISPEMRTKMFQPFFTTKATGTGLGLAIVARRIAEMGGTISCESPLAEGKGTRFRLMLPLADRSRSDDPMRDNAGDHANHSDRG